jgi:hypothetical protein
LATIRRHHLAAVLVTLLAFIVAPASAGAAVRVNLRVEGPTNTVVASSPVPFVGTVKGHPLAQPTVLGALITATRNHGVGLGLQWFDCCGFFVNSIDGVPGNATHFWALKVGHTLAPLGAGSTPASNGQKVLFYYTSFDPVTFATEPTLGLHASKRIVHRRGKVTFRVVGYNDAGVGTTVTGANIWRKGRIVAHTNAKGNATLKFRKRGTYPVRATSAGKIRSQRLWITVS